MPTPSRKRTPAATRRRALELLEHNRDGCTEAITLAHGFTADMLVELVTARLAIAQTERMVAVGARSRSSAFASRRPAAGHSRSFDGPEDGGPIARRRLLAGASRFGARVTSIQPAFGR